LLKLDPGAIFSGRQSVADALRDVHYSDLDVYTDEIYNEIAAIIADANDAAVIFVPRDPASEGGEGQGWTLGHVIAHLTATSEEAAAAAAMMARGVNLEQRLHYEVAWETITSGEQVRERVQESYRMCRALLDAWPSAAHLEVELTPIPQLGPMNAIGRYVLGLFHAQSHLEQLREIMRQAAS
jgi:hypothetical protein